MKSNFLQKFIAGTAVAAATMLGMVKEAQADTITFELASTNTLPFACKADGITYVPGMRAKTVITLNLATAGTGKTNGNSGYSVLYFPDGTTTNIPVDTAVMFNSGGRATYANVQGGGNVLYFQLQTPNSTNIGTFDNSQVITPYLAMFENVNTNKQIAIVNRFAVPTPASPDFSLTHIKATATNGVTIASPVVQPKLSITMSNKCPVVSFAAQPGQTYQLLTNSRVASTNWGKCSEVLGMGDTVAIPFTNITAPQMYFKVAIPQ